MTKLWRKFFPEFLRKTWIPRTERENYPRYCKAYTKYKVQENTHFTDTEFFEMVPATSTETLQFILSGSKLLEKSKNWEPEIKNIKVILNAKQWKRYLPYPCVTLI